MSEITAAIIGGGRARRLGGGPKHLLEIAGQRIVDRQLDVLRRVFPAVFAVSSDRGPWQGLGLDVVADRVPDAGPLGGIDAALAALPPGVAGVVCVACDMPFLDERALALLRDFKPDAPAVVPRIAGHLEPLFARYGRACAEAARAQLAAGDFAVNRFCVRVGADYVPEAALRAIDPALRFLVNVNTPAELRAAR